MPVLLRLHGALLLCVLGCATTAFAADKYRVGDPLASLTFKDQHARSYTSDASLRLVVVAFAMNPAKAANTFFAQQPAAFLDEHHAIFVMDVHNMPGFVRRFVVPKLRQQPHRILLADSADPLARFPEAPDQVTVLRLDEQGRIAAIRSVEPAKGLAEVFRSPVPAAARQPSSSPTGQ